MGNLAGSERCILLGVMSSRLNARGVTTTAEDVEPVPRDVPTVSQPLLMPPLCSLLQVDHLCSREHL